MLNYERVFDVARRHEFGGSKNWINVKWKCLLGCAAVQAVASRVLRHKLLGTKSTKKFWDGSKIKLRQTGKSHTSIAVKIVAIDTFDIFRLCLDVPCLAPHFVHLAMLALPGADPSNHLEVLLDAGTAIAGLERQTFGHAHPQSTAATLWNQRCQKWTPSRRSCISNTQNGGRWSFNDDVVPYLPYFT